MNNFERTLEDLWALVDDLRGVNHPPRLIDSRPYPAAYTRAGDELAKLLPPRPKQYDIVKWYEALEGLATGIYRRGQPEILFEDDAWAVWNEHGLRYERGEKNWPINKFDIRRWRVEVA